MNNVFTVWGGRRVFRGARFRTSLLEWAWIESLSRLSTAARKGLLRRESSSDVGKLLNDSLNTHSLATQVELMSFAIRSVSFCDKRSNLGMNDTLFSTRKHQDTVPSVRSCLCEWIAAMALKIWEALSAVVCLSFAQHTWPDNSKSRYSLKMVEKSAVTACKSPAKISHPKLH